ncbi:hypothetical protein SKAU_G00021300 [Synaphobranchus kaupii]|uniref:Uncharacterized protein n=1 Tax=Synaphobranchus kaupii TaxID=118154 RepID=A0A9Q1GCC3_SYNKA|nr:hypothetical protein SKAU_G00021300 [Synaphobranchus kaupii]
MDTEEGLRHIPHSGVKVVCQRAYITQAPEYRLIDQLGASPSAIPTAYAFPKQLEISPLEQISRDEIKKAQDLDSAIGTAKRGMRNGTWPPTTKSDNPDVAILEREAPKSVIRDGLLYRKTTRPTGRETLQLVLPVDAANKTHNRNKRRYDARVRNQALESGDRVLIRATGLTGKHKLSDRWVSLPDVVVNKLPNIPVYQVKPERGRCIVKTLHRDHLLPIGSLVRMPDGPGEKTLPCGPVTRSARKPDVDGDKSENKDSKNELEAEMSESEDERSWDVPVFSEKCLTSHATPGRAAEASPTSELCSCDPGFGSRNVRQRRECASSDS